MTIVFDVNGTLLDTQALPALDKLFRGKLRASEWFGTVLQYSMALSLAGEFMPLQEIADGVLRMMAAARSVKWNQRHSALILQAIASLPLFPDVLAGLQRLQKSGHRLAVLSNSGTHTLREQLQSAGITHFFDRAVSVEQFRRYKPSAEIYLSAARSLDISTKDMLMVAAHPWDLIGARRAGCRIAFLRRPGGAWFPAASAPDFEARSLGDLANKLGAEVEKNNRPFSKPIAFTGVALTGLGLVASAVLMCRAPQNTHN